MQLSIISSADEHGHFDRMPYHAELINRLWEDTSGEKILVFGGDMLQGTYETALDRGKTATTIANVLSEGKQTVAVVGDHDFGFGIHRFAQVVENSTFPWISANLKFNETGLKKLNIQVPTISKYVITPNGDALVGLTTPNIKRCLSPFPEQRALLEVMEADPNLESPYPSA